MDTLSRYKILTITHKSTPLKNIGKFVLPDLDTAAAFTQKMQQIKTDLKLDELMYVATCNRVIFFYVTNQLLDQHFIANFQEVVYPTLDMQLDTSALSFTGERAINHLLEVAASTDSLVIGEREILRQLRTSYEQCLGAKLTGDCIRIAIKLSIETAKKVYSNTRIGEKSVSVVSLAIRQLLAKNPSKDARFLIVGAGQTNTLVGKFLLKYGFQNFMVFNRSLDNAQQLAGMLGCEAATLDELPNYQQGFDILVACTGATEAVITEAIYEKIVLDSDKKILIDLAIPNNIESTIQERFATDYIEIDGLKELVNENLAFREKEVIKAHEIIHEQAKRFKADYKGRQVELALKEVPGHIKAIRQHAVDKVFKNEVASLDDETKELIERMMSYMEKRCIAIPIQVAKQNLAGVTSVKKIPSV
jgi:glutamyl-tRNA reductase